MKHMKRPWCETRYRGNLVDMHIPDWNSKFLSEFDSKTYVDMLEKAHVNAAYLYASSCLGICYWPTKVGHQHNRIKGRDILGERIHECHRRGMDVIVYHNWWSKWAYDAHPDWRFVTAKGENTADYLWTPGHYGVCCFNSPYSDFLIAQIEELCAGYAFEGLWIDMIFWPYTVCYCSHCRRRYHEETGKDLPKIVNWENPEWVAFQRRREAWLADYVGRITATARRLKPGITVGYQFAAWSLGWICGVGSKFCAHSDYASGDFYGGAAEQSFVCKLFMHLTEKPLFEFMTSRCPDLNDHTTMKSRELLAAQAYSALAHNGRIFFIDAIDPVGTLNPNVFDELGAVAEKTMPYEPFLTPDAKPLADVGIYFNFESMINPKDNGKPVAAAGAAGVPLTAAITNIARTLMQGHVSYGVLTPKNLNKLHEFPIIVLPELFMIDASEADALRNYVQQGGCLYATRSTSLLTKDGVKQADFLLADVFGISWTGETVEEVTYMAPTPGNEGLFAPYTAKHPLTIKGAQMKVKARDSAHVLATITLPYTDPKDPLKFSSAISNPNGIPTSDPAIVLNQYGKGKVLYVAGCLDCMEHDAHRTIFRRLLDTIAPQQPRLKTDVPKSVEALVFDQAAEKRLIMSVLNFQADLPNIPVIGARIAVRLDGRRPLKLLRFPENTAVKFMQRNGYAEFEIPRIDTFLMFGLLYE
ncbi:MAG: family 10 glycosylhydrolase [Kiritimatiellaeota bacterium]|nr:family 10 glycosylhydrolase [Kiritimatiellota bacterium]